MASEQASAPNAHAPLPFALTLLCPLRITPSPIQVLFDWNRMLRMHNVSGK